LLTLCLHLAFYICFFAIQFGVCYNQTLRNILPLSHLHHFTNKINDINDFETCLWFNSNRPYNMVKNLPLRILARSSSTISWFRIMFKQIAGPCVNGHLVIGFSFGYTNNESQLQRKFRTFVVHVKFWGNLRLKSWKSIVR
jgi:hypothetical protein